MSLRRAFRMNAEVVVHTKDGRSIKGLLRSAHKDTIVIAHPVHILPGGESADIGADDEGRRFEALIPRENVSFVQQVFG